MTKELLMRIDLNEIINHTSYAELDAQIDNISIEDWIYYKSQLQKKKFEKNQQLNLFVEQAQLKNTMPNAGLVQN